MSLYRRFLLRFKMGIISLAPLVSGDNLWAGHTAPPMSFGFSDYATYQDPMLVLNAYGFPVNPMKKGVKELSIVPAYINSFSRFSEGQGQGLDSLGGGSGSSPGTNNGSFSDNKAKGGGAIFSWFHGLSDHWGYSLSAGFIKMSGKTFAFAEYNAADNLIRRHDADESGTSIQTAALAIFDPFSHPDGFRLPLFAGYGFLFQDQNADYSAPVSVIAGNPAVRFRSKFSTVIPGLIFGGSAQFNTGPFRWAPFLAIQIKNVAPSVENKVTNETTGAVLASKSFSNGDSFLPSGGIGVQFKPWGLEFRYVPNLVAVGEWESTNSTTFTLSKVFRFGDAQ